MGGGVRAMVATTLAVGGKGPCRPRKNWKQQQRAQPRCLPVAASGQAAHPCPDFLSGRTSKARRPLSAPLRAQRVQAAASGTPVVATPAACAESLQQKKVVWVETCSKDVMTRAVECGFDRMVFKEGEEARAEDWQKIAGFQALFVSENGDVTWRGSKIAVVRTVTDGAGIDSVVDLAESESMVVMDATGWQVIPAENLVASFAATPSQVLAVAATASDAQLMLEALEIGTDGVLLRTESSLEVTQLAEYLKGRAGEAIQLVEGTVTRVEPVGMGDRACVDLCSLLVPGEGMLVGSFCAGLMLVHSECLVSDYISSRPFRVNAGPVHAYCLAPGGKTAYLSELKSGQEVLVSNGEGRTRTAIVGRVKIESRPLVLVEAEHEGTCYSALLQNAETVRLVAPGGKGGEEGAVSVSVLEKGDKVLVHLPGGARHTGIAINESIVEK